MKIIYLLLLITFTLSGCTRSFDGGFTTPLLYKIDIQQGNVIEQDMLDKLKPGMDKDQVRFIMGTPVIIDPFHSERWEYIYSYQKGGGVREQRYITLHFVDEKLSYITGDIEAGSPVTDDDGIVTDETVVVPDSENNGEGFFEKLWDAVTPGN